MYIYVYVQTVDAVSSRDFKSIICDIEERTEILDIGKQHGVDINITFF